MESVVVVSVMVKRMMTKKELEAIKPCVQSGYCCTVRPCPFGVSQATYKRTGMAFGNGLDNDSLSHSVIGYHKTEQECIYLAPPDDTGRRFCLIYKEIREAEKMSGNPQPMMGSGCSSPLFNTARDLIVEQMKERGEYERELRKQRRRLFASESRIFQQRHAEKSK